METIQYVSTDTNSRTDRSKGVYGSSGSSAEASVKSTLRSSCSKPVYERPITVRNKMYVPVRASAMSTRIHCMVSTLVNFLSSFRYSRAYERPSDSRSDSVFALG